MGTPCDETLGNHSKGLPGGVFTHSGPEADIGQRARAPNQITWRVWESGSESFSIQKLFFRERKDMHIETVWVRNFRRLKDTRIDLASDISIFVGANNSDKTSAAHALQLFTSASKDRFTLHDFSSECWNAINAFGEGADGVELRAVLRQVFAAAEKVRVVIRLGRILITQIDRLLSQ